jgi:hypothetical protein
MTDFDKYWQKLVDKNAGLADPGLRLSMTVESLKSQIKRAYDAATADQKKFHESLDKLKSKLGGGSSIFGDLFK